MNFRYMPARTPLNSASYLQRIPCVSYLTGSVAGLSAGAAVTLHGIRIGKVGSVALQYDPRTKQVVVPVHFDLEPGRVTGMKLSGGGGLDAEMGELVQRGCGCSWNPPT